MSQSFLFNKADIEDNYYTIYKKLHKRLEICIKSIETLLVLQAPCEKLMPALTFAQDCWQKELAAPLSSRTASPPDCSWRGRAAARVS